MLLRFSVLGLLALAPPLAAHEFWIAPESYRIEANAPILAQLKIGEKFEGAVQRYFPNQFERFEVHLTGVTHAVEGRLGDDPALAMAGLGNGLLVVIHETTDSVLSYRDRTKFDQFVLHKGAPEILELHRARGLPDQGFRESYRRYAKSLIAAGDGRGRDFRAGMTYEIVALANPYTEDLRRGMPVQVFHLDRPRADARIELFAREEGGDVSVETYQTGADGIAVLPVHSGVEYLVDAVLIEPLANDDPARGPVWRSLWASLTFLVPRR